MESFWSVLLPEILDMILQRLLLPDCLTFHKVCQSWRSVFLERRRLSRPPPCMLFIGSDQMPDELYGLYGGQLRKIKYPNLVDRQPERIIWSSKDWLLIVSYPRVSGLTLYLLNSASYKRIPYPSFPVNGDSLCIFNVALSSTPCSESCILAINGSVDMNNPFFAWCRMGVNDKWSYFEDSLKPAFNVKDMMFHKEKLYILGDKGKFDVYTFDPQPERTYSDIGRTDENGHWFKQQLVQSGGDLLYVRRRREEPYMIDLFKQEEENGRWVRVNSLGDGVLLLGHHAQLFCIHDLMGSGFERNCIYFPKYPSSEELVKFSLEDRSSQIISISFAHDGFLWIIPQTW